MASFPSSFPPPCKSQFSAREFFKDSPWLNVPADRRADILIEPLHPPLGLLGGASEGRGKTSKLAALAAARKKKESHTQTQTQTTNGGGVENPAGSLDTAAAPPVGETPEQETNRSLALLDRLVTNGRNRGTPEERTARLPLRKADRNRQRVPQKTTSPSPAAGAQPTSKEEAVHSPDTTTSADTETKGKPRHPAAAEDLRARPSTFATTIIGDGDGQRALRRHCFSVAVDMTAILDQSFTEAFDFTEPSPDDVVINAQSAGKGICSYLLLYIY